jgi:hypothetical protein
MHARADCSPHLFGRSYFKCLHADPNMAKPEEVFVFMGQEYVLSVRFVVIIIPPFSVF